MGNNLSLEERIFYSIHDKECKKSPEQVAGEMGTRYNTLLRKVSITDEGTGLFVHELIPFMKAIENYSVLDKLNEMAGRLYITHPKGIRKGTDPKKDINEYQQDFHEVMKLLHQFLASPGDQSYSKLDTALKKHIGDTVNLKRRAKKHLLHQTELDF